MSFVGAFRVRRHRRASQATLAWATGALLLTGCSASDPLSTSAALPDDAVVYVIERGWHTDVGLAIETISGKLATLEHAFPGVRFLTFGFGERQFLLDRRMTSGTMLGALLPSRSALLTTALSATPQAAFGLSHVVELRVSRAGLERIEARLWRELEQSADGEPVLLADGPYPGSMFYAARDTYDGFYTCNTWTAEVLHAGGLPMPTAGVLFVGQVMGMARWVGAHQSSLR